MKHPNQHKGAVSALRAPAQRGPAQDMSRHTPRAAASHLSPAEITKRDKAKVDDDAAALAKSLAVKLLKPPHPHVYVAGACKVCGVKEPEP